MAGLAAGVEVVFGDAGFFFATGFLAGFLAAGFGGGGAGVSATATGLGCNSVGLPVSTNGTSASVSGWNPVSVKVTVSGASTGKASAQGVRHVCPFDVLASAPGGSDSNWTVLT